MTSPPSESTRRPSSVAVGLCYCHAVGAPLAAAFIWRDVEAVLGAGPALAILGLALAPAAMARDSANWFALAVWHPLLTAAFALMVAGFSWSPNEAAHPARVIFTLSAAIVSPWSLVLARRPVGGRAPAARTIGARPRFSLRTVLIATTVACILLATASRLSWRHEMAFFAMYGLIMLAVASALTYFFVWSAPRLPRDATAERSSTANGAAQVGES